MTERSGPGEMGAGMADPAKTRCPAKDVLPGSARRTFTASERAADALDDEQCSVPFTSEMPWEGTRRAGEYLVEHLEHDHWGLGDIAGPRRAQDLPRAIA